MFSTAAGEKIEASFFPQFPSQGVYENSVALGDTAPEVTATTAVARWQGETCDYDMAVHAMLQRVGKLERAQAC